MAAAAAVPTAAAPAFAPALVALMSTAACYEVVLARLLRAKSAPLEDPAFLMFVGLRASGLHFASVSRFGVQAPGSHKSHQRQRFEDPAPEVVNTTRTIFAKTFPVASTWHKQRRLF